MDKARGALWFTVVFAAVVVALVVPSKTPAEEAVYFGYDFSDGYSQRYEINFSEEMSSGTFSRTSIFDLEITERCTGVTEDGSFEMEIVFDKVEASVMMFDQMRETHIGEQLTGQAIGFLLDKHGEHSDLRATGYIESWEQYKSTIEMFVDMFYIELPGKGYTQGDDWDRTDEQDHDGLNTTSHSVYNFGEMKKEKGRECAKVKVETEVGLGGVLATPGGDYRTEGEGEGEGELYFDSGDGLVVKLKSKMEVKLDMTPASGKGEDQEFTQTYELERKLL
jgi:hypothetical protein